MLRDQIDALNLQIGKLTDRAARYCDLGPAWYSSRIDRDRKIRSHVRQLEALGYAVTHALAA